MWLKSNLLRKISIKLKSLNESIEIDDPLFTGCVQCSEAVCSLQTAVVELLILFGCDLNTADYESTQTSIHIAVKMGNNIFTIW